MTFRGVNQMKSIFCALTGVLVLGLSVTAAVNAATSTTFLPPAFYAAGSLPEAIAAGNFNSDMFPDLVVANYGSGNVSVLLNSGTGTFGGPINTPVGPQPRSIAVGDFNHDGKLDIAVATSAGVAVLFGSGTGLFCSPVTYPAGATPYYVVAGDFNGD